MDVKEFLNIIGSEFYTGVPDSLLRPVCDYLIDTYGTSGKHIIAANEGNAVAIAAGYYMATGKAAVVYMQNSGIGNTINPVASLLSSDVYAIPCIFIVGWRGEPGIKDEPQHLYQGKVTDRLLEDMDIAAYHLKKIHHTMNFACRCPLSVHCLKREERSFYREQRSAFI